MKTLRFFHIMLFLVVFLSGCLSPTLPEKTRPEVVDFTPQALKISDFAQEIEKLTGITRDSKSSAMEKAEAHRRLAILYLSPRNPKSDFRNAVNELGKFLEIAPHGLDQSTAASWATALQSAKEFQDMKEQQQTLKKKVSKLKKRNDQLSIEKKELEGANLELKRTIESLKKLDLSLEKKRRNLR